MLDHVEKKQNKISGVENTDDYTKHVKNDRRRITIKLSLLKYLNQSNYQTSRLFFASTV
jgi:hypothetical protein